MKKFIYLLLLFAAFFSGTWFGFQKADQTYIIRTIAEGPQAVVAVASAPVKIVTGVGVDIVKGIKKIVMFPVEIITKQNIKRLLR